MQIMRDEGKKRRQHTWHTQNGRTNYMSIYTRARSIHKHQEQENGEENSGKRREAMDYNWDQIVEGHACIEGRESKVDSAEQARKEH